MPRIHVLPPAVANRIAAGEVVERPASVVKELLENALDAGATEIEVVAEESGTKLIEVSDNGAGMDERDARLAFERHATSKLSSAADLERIGSFGFRGEALPSIASVSVVECTTSCAGGEAVQVVLRAGESEATNHTSRIQGTTIAVRNLFHNTPARRNFLKSAAVEEREIRRAVIAHALAQTEVAFRYVRDGDEIFRLPRGEELLERIARIFGKRISDPLVAVAGSERGPVIGGYASNIDSTFANRNYQYFAVNRRPVKMPLLTQAAQTAYREFLAPRRFPAIFLSIEIDPSFVDINIHPTKREVRFSPERTVFSAIHAALTRAIRSEKSLPSFWGGKGGPKTTGAGEVIPGHPSSAMPLPLAERSTAWQYRAGPAGGVGDIPDTRPSPIDRHADLASATGMETPVPGTGARDGWIDHVDLGSVHQISNTFLVASGPDGIIVVDQHTAHERILFEETVRRMNEGEPESQRLLFPETVDVDPDLVTTIEEHALWIEKAGFELRPTGPRAVILEAVPSGVRGNPADFLRDFLEHLSAGSGEERRGSRRVAASIACHGAVRAGDALSPEERSALLRSLIQCDQPLRCPHGRPTFLAIPTGELARRFLRE